jgi:hypothetical protein
MDHSWAYPFDTSHKHYFCSISTNWSSTDGSGVESVLEALSRTVAELTSIDEDELLIEIRLGTPMCFGGRTKEHAAHCLWAFGGYGDKWQNRDLHEAVGSGKSLKGTM